MTELRDDPPAAAGRPGPDLEGRATERLGALWDDDRPVDYDAFAAMFNLFRVSTRVLHFLETEVHRPLGLSLAGFRILFVTWVFGTLEPRQIARLAGVSRAAVSSSLNTLERDGLAVRRRDQADRRLVTVNLTAAGEAMLARAYDHQHGLERELFGDIPPEELAHFTSVLRRLMAAPLPEDDDED